ncbi:acyl carrier protein [Frankia sp. CNm7]|uniref:Acyl carrier protein n=1 Tax=Frankia nepalensis TaxID=1836974 RepID=A0A937RF98_9ACTN|nr:acyl carrier protein [Frankia nepalensis]MBL7500516.1 acyl carrier protein [Frankia nepalensis]MBL7509790.1 acyl carrier protein [Frankia nepalensis]MBL7522194.1 acyl carrier protein [Frankia nepalensis]MBL7627910.1 acyl carrier protein [Frankia nepalensis]
MSVSTDELISEITGIVAEELGLSPDAVSPDADLRAVEGADSVKVLRVVARIERSHDVELEDEEVFGASTIREVAEVLKQALTETAAV